MFELCRRMIQFNIQYNTISKKINSNNYSIQYISQIFNSKIIQINFWVGDSIKKEIQFNKWGSTAIG